MSRKTFRVYTKTFGGKIWTNLHRVSPGNFFGKNFNKASFKNYRQKLLNSVSCKKNWRAIVNSISVWIFFFVQKKLWPNNFLQTCFVLDFNSLHETISGSSLRKSIMASYGASAQKCLIFFQNCGRFQLKIWL